MRIFPCYLGGTKPAYWEVISPDGRREKFITKREAVEYYNLHKED